MNSTSDPQSVKTQVLSRIEAEKVCPHGRFFFFCYDSLVWIFWGLSVGIGAVAVAVALYVVTSSRTSLYEVTHGSFWTSFVEAAPYLWLVVFTVMCTFAILNLRYTKRGYRFTVVQVMASSVVLSLAGGALLQLAGLGAAIDNQLGDGMPMYKSQDERERELWQNPAAGRLYGTLVVDTATASTSRRFRDGAEVEWELIVSELASYDVDLIESFESVRVVGVVITETPPRFHACGVFPWVLRGDGASRTSERQAFLERLYSHKKHEQDRLLAIEANLYEPGSFDPETMSTCANLAMMRKMEVRAGQ